MNEPMRQFCNPEFLVTRELVESLGPSPLEPAAIVYADSELMRQECERRITEAIEHASRPDLSIVQRSYVARPSDVFRCDPSATTTIASTTVEFNLDVCMETYRKLKSQFEDLRASERDTLLRLTVLNYGKDIDPIIAELDRLGFKVYLNIDYDPPCSGNAIVLLASEGKLVQFKSIHWGLQNEPERADCQDRCRCPQGV